MENVKQKKLSMTKRPLKYMAERNCGQGSHTNRVN